MAGYTKQERSLIAWMRISAVLSLASAILFVALPQWTIDYITNIGCGIFGWRSPIIHSHLQTFLAPAAAFMIASSYLCFVVQANPSQHFEYVKFLIIAELVSAAIFTSQIFFESAQFFYLTGAILFAAIFIITLVVYKLAERSRNRWI